MNDWLIHLFFIYLFIYLSIYLFIRFILSIHLLIFFFFFFFFWGGVAALQFNIVNLICIFLIAVSRVLLFIFVYIMPKKTILNLLLLCNIDKEIIKQEGVISHGRTHVHSQWRTVGRRIVGHWPPPSPAWCTSRLPSA